MAAMMNRTKIADDVFLVRFQTQYEVASTFLRFQEYFESRRFSGRVFTLEQFMDWYAKEFGNFTYFQDWSGFNIPSRVLTPFYEGRFEPLLEKEQRLLDLFRNDTGLFYVIGVSAPFSRGELWHELAHALYFVRPEYRSAVADAMKHHDTSSLESALYRSGYGRHVLKDEAHCYLLTGATGILSAHERVKLETLRKELRVIFNNHGADLLRTTWKRIGR
jgi:hypothetical protein